MKLVCVTLIPERRSGSCTFGRHYEANCPYCGHMNWMWPSEWTDRKPEGTSKCRHFDGLNKDGAVRFRKNLSIVVKPKTVTINGVKLNYSIRDLDYHLDELSYHGMNDYESTRYDLRKVLPKLFAVSHSYSCGHSFNDRFEDIVKAVAKLAKRH